MPQVANDPSPESVKMPEALDPSSLREISRRVSGFTESLIDGAEPTHSKNSQAVKELAEAGLRNLNTVLISNPALLSDRAVRYGVNKTLARLNPDPENPRIHRAVSSVDSPFGLAAAFERAGIILREDMKSPEEHYRLIGRLASGSLRTLAVVNSRIQEIEDGIAIATAERGKQDAPLEYRLPVRNSSELDQELVGAIGHFTAAETKRNHEHPDLGKISGIA
ncbi:hypothetical protein HZB74_00490 [Candidatus Saccharibacteria bacterium]|nr:hypothetical protein [Candidatus Saccharibacteria bacterium]